MHKKPLLLNFTPVYICFTSLFCTDCSQLPLWASVHCDSAKHSQTSHTFWLQQTADLPGRMSENKKLETAEELHSLFSDLERLKNYKYTQPVVSDCGIDNEKFHLDLPYDEIKAIVESCRDKFLAAIPEVCMFSVQHPSFQFDIRLTSM